MSKSLKPCLICGVGRLTARVSQTEVEYRKHRAKLDLHYSKCDTYGCVSGDSAQLKINKQIMVDFKSEIDNKLA